MQLRSARGPCPGRGSEARGAFTYSAPPVLARSRGAARAGHSLYPVTSCGQLGGRPCPVCAPEPWSGHCRALCPHPVILAVLSSFSGSLFSATSSDDSLSYSRPWLAGVPVTHTAYTPASSSLAPEPCPIFLHPRHTSLTSGSSSRVTCYLVPDPPVSRDSAVHFQPLSLIPTCQPLPLISSLLGTAGNRVQ